MKHAVAHDLDEATARTAVECAWKCYRERFEKYEPTGEWTSDTCLDIGFRVKGIALKGRLELEPGAIAIDLKVPLPLRLFRKTAIKVIGAEVQRWVDKANEGSL